MGCTESREKGYASEHLLSSLETSDSSSSVPRMGQPPSQPQIESRAGQPSTIVAQPQFASQHERLLLELLPIKDAPQFHEWLNSVYVLGSWNEFVRDFLARNPMAPEPEKTKVAQMTKEAINSKNPKYLVYHPAKGDWTLDDHYIRFMATLVLDNMLKGLWPDSEWRRRGADLDIAKAAYEVLSFLRATALNADSRNADSGPPEYED